MADPDFHDDRFDGKRFAELCKKIEQALGELDELHHPNFHRSAAPHLGDPRDLRFPTWSSQQLIDIIHAAACTEQFVAHPPDQIDFSGFLPVFTRLETLTKRGSEYGRAATVNLSSKRIFFGETAVGDEHSVSIPVQSTPFKVPILTVHSHPTSSTARDSYHFSATDICSFLELSSLQFTVVVAEGLTLIAMRTDATPRYNDQVEARILKLRDSMRSSMAGDMTGDRAIRFTKDVCKMLNLALYRIKHSDGSGVAKRVIN